MRANTELEQRLREALLQGPPLRLAMLFGSTADGTEHSLSDVDIAIIPKARDLSLADELSLQAQLERVCRRNVDLVRLDQASTLLRWRVAEQVELISLPLYLVEQAPRLLQ